MKLRAMPSLIAAAITLAAGNASAGLELQQLGFYAANGSANSVFFDLGTTMSQFTPAAASAPGTTITWDLVNSTVTGGTPGSTALTYGSVWSGFTFSPTTIWGVIAPDKTAGDIFTTTAASVPLIDTMISANAANASDGVELTYYFAISATGTHATSDNGAAFNTAGNALHYNGIGASDSWRNQSPFASGLAGSGSMPFYSLQYDLVNGDDAPVVRTNFAGTWTLDAAGGTLTYAVPIPEASTYAMMGLGLVVLGAIARRRKV